jgi:hypothetical protein
LSSVAGGIGSLVALVYPTIRAYDRFPLFLIFVLYVAAGLVMTLVIRRSGGVTKAACTLMVPVVAILSLIDQTPVNTIQRDISVAPRFLAERHFVQAIEASLSKGAMVYQFPHSQYLMNSPYYGWGDFRHVRAYLHSQHLRWSNGAAKNSWVDNWHMQMAQLPTVALSVEMQAVGFRGFMVDRQVVKDEEYTHIRAALMDHLGQSPIEDDVAGLAFWTLPNPGYQIEYDRQFQNVERIAVADPRAGEGLRLPRLIRRDALLRILAAAPPGQTVVVERHAHPEAFRDAAELNRGLGMAKIEPLEAMQSEVTCSAGMNERPLSVKRDSLTVVIANQSNFDWRLNAGPHPIRLGLKELISGDGTRLRWDGGFRLPGSLMIASGEATEVSIPLRDLNLPADLPWGQQEIIGVFSMLQDGHAWFGEVAGNSECRVSLAP